MELYGRAKGGIVSKGVSKSAIPQGPYRRFEYLNDFDTNGILYWLGTRGGSTGWTNPAESGLVSVTSSEVLDNSKPISAICGRDLVRCVTKEKVNAFWMIDFKNMKVNVTGYTLKHYASWNIEALRSWKVEGKNPGGSWKLIAQYDNDTSLKGKGGTATFKVNSTEFFQQISLMMTGKNDNGHWMLACSGVELYGTVAGGLVTTSNSNVSDSTVQRDFDDEKGLEPGQAAVRPHGGAVMVNMDGNCSVQVVGSGNMFKVVGVSNFPTIRMNGTLTGGRWYYECHLLTAGCMQIGWADEGFIANQAGGSGVGDHASSWAYDGWRQKKWNGGGSVRYGGAAKWKIGDTVGCCVDVEGGTVRFYLNGQDLGVAYSGLKFRNNGVYPAGSFQGGNSRESGVFVFDDGKFRQSVPVGYRAINATKYFIVEVD